MTTNSVCLSEKNLQPIPLAYFITFTCYGTWLHGGKTISVDKKHNAFTTPFLQPNPIREKNAKESLQQIPYLLDVQCRDIALQAIREVCQYRGWILHAAHVRTNHIHLVVDANTNPEKILSMIKAYATRRLREIESNDSKAKHWTRHGSTRYLWRPQDVSSVIDYVVRQQGEPMAVFER